MSDAYVADVSRRHFLQGTGLIIGLTILPKTAAASVTQGNPRGVEGVSQSMNAFVRVAPDNQVTVLSKHLEMGQGPYTGLTQLVAEELDADWGQMHVEASPVDDEVYKNFALGMQLTGGSTSIANSYDQFRKAGATAKAMLVMAAAARWGVPQNALTVSKGVISHKASGKSANFGELAEDAAAFSPPQDVLLKSRDQFTIIGTHKQRLDTPAKTNGSAVFTMDVIADDMLYAVVAHPPKFGATVDSVVDKDALKVTGVIMVKTIPQGVAVYATSTYAALKGRDQLSVTWSEAKAETRSSKQIENDFRKAMSSGGFEASATGDVEAALAKQDVTVVEQEYVFPFLAHAPMEPLDAVLLKNREGGIECYAGAQFPGGDADAIAKVCGVNREQVTVHVQLAGGSFGRRAQFGSPYMTEVAEVFKASGMDRPVKHIMTREDDIKGGFYRPLTIHKLKAALDNDGNIVAWDQHVACQSLMGKQGELDETSVEGAREVPYQFKHHRCMSYNTSSKVPVLWWRSVGHTHTGYTVEAFIDELLEKGSKDPIEGRLALMQPGSRDAGVLRTVAKMAEEAGPVASNAARGVAVHKSFSTYVAQIAEVTRNQNGEPNVTRVWVAVDCGVAVNPNHIKAQVEGGVGFGVGAILYDEVVLSEGGTVEQSNFHDYRSLRMSEMPHVEVTVIQSDASPTGVGEPGVPPIGPAVANAWRRLTGESTYRLPMVKAAQA